MLPDTRIIAGQWTHLLRTAASSGTILPPAMRTTVCTPVPDRHEGFSHQIVHNGEVIGLARDLHYDGDIVTVTGKLYSCKAPPGKLLMHRSWLRPITFPLSEVNHSE